MGGQRMDLSANVLCGLQPSGSPSWRGPLSEQRTTLKRLQSFLVGFRLVFLLVYTSFFLFFRWMNALMQSCLTFTSLKERWKKVCLIRWHMESSYALLFDHCFTWVCPKIGTKMVASQAIPGYFLLSRTYCCANWRIGLFRNLFPRFDVWALHRASVGALDRLG